MQSLEKQFPREEGYRTTYRDFKFNQETTELCIQLEIPSENDNCVLGLDPISAKVYAHLSGSNISIANEQ